MHSAAEVNCTDQTEMYIFNLMGYETKRKLKLTMNLAMFCSVLLDGGRWPRRWWPDKKGNAYYIRMYHSDT
jgi:hypothetical protein